MSDQGIDEERAEIEADLRQQGLLGEVTYDDVAATFGLYESMEPPDEIGPPPSPAMGEDFRYEPQPGEEDIFAPPGETPA